MVSADGAPAVSLGLSLQGPDSGFTFTDPSGQAAFSDLALGDYTLTAYASGPYQETTVSFALTTEEPSWSGTIEREPWPTGPGSIETTILDATTDLPVAGLHVTVSRTDAIGPLFDGTTDANGVFTVTGLVAGEYAVASDATPEYLGATEWITVADGLVTTTIHALAADATIMGRVIDPDGVGVADLFVNAQMSGPYFGWVTGVTDSNGYYVLEDAAAGTWTVGTLADANWEGSTIEVDVQGGSTVTAPDLVLTPRVTGTISGLVATSDGVAEAEEGGFFDVCVTVLNPDGSTVAGASVVTGGDGFYYFWLAPGDYTVYFEDCDSNREPHGYQPAYLGGSTTLTEATLVTVETNVDVWLDTTVLEPQASFPEPDHSATPVRTRDLESADEDLIDAPAALRRGETAEVVVGTEYAGQWVSAWLHSRPTQLGEWHQVSPEGTIEITVPTHHPLGIHELVVQDADDEVLGWTELRVLQRAK